jgi:hypothetical protein
MRQDLIARGLIIGGGRQTLGDVVVRCCVHEGKCRFPVICAACSHRIPWIPVQRNLL